MSLRLIGYRFSVYTWAVRMALAVVGRDAEYAEVDPFDAGNNAALTGHHPFGRVPVLWDGDFRIFETGAILGYLLPPSTDPKTAARARQVSGIIDNYGYLPLVRQVFSQRVFGPASGEATDEDEVSKGMGLAPTVLAALNEIAAEGLVLNGAGVGVADCHLAPMIGYFAKVPEGRDMLAQYPALAAWFGMISQHASYVTTQPDLTAIGDDP